MTERRKRKSDRLDVSTIQTTHVRELDGFGEQVFDHTPRSTPTQRILALCHFGNIDIQYWWEHYEEQLQSVGRDTYYLMFTGGQRELYQGPAQLLENYLITQYPDESIKPIHIPRVNMYVWNVILEKDQ